MRVVIFANGVLSNPKSAAAIIQPDDFIIAADGGLKHCQKLGLNPKVMIGDFDSINSSELEKNQKLGVKIIQHPATKDYTDLELAIQHAQELSSQEILIFGALGARWDQTLANILLPTLKTLTGTKITLLDDRDEIHYIDARQTSSILEIHGKIGDTVSLIPLISDAQGITTVGLEYPLNDGTLQVGATQGISNVLVKDSAKVMLKQGLLICIVIHQDHEF